ncbi:MAG: DNA-processing protein DprA [Candidatus Omnitrophica bacterium]|nr:DNA-processing protein DprA [Candidatus Omnitrophota bacterium]
MRSAHDVLDWLKIALTPGVGPANFFQLIQAFGTPDKILGASEREIQSVPRLKPDVIRDLIQTQEGGRDAEAKKEADRIEKLGISILTLKDSLYPKRLAHIPTPPPLLFYRGRIEEQDNHHFAIVGTRRCDSYGLRQTRTFAAELASAGLIVVSGLALGIDTAAHRGALTAEGKTWAFLPGGFGKIYPPENLSLAEEIAETGALISERPLDAQPLRTSFPARNRLVSGVSAGVLVVQAPAKSGALITARLAMEQGRDVFALPGRIDEPSSRGPHRLIQDGAKLALSSEEILNELNLELDGVPAIVRRPRTQRPGLTRDSSQTKRKRESSTPETRGVRELAKSLSDPIDQRIVLRLEHGPVHIDRLSGDLDVPVKTVSERLLLLEMEGHVKRLPGMSFDLS